MVVDVHAHGLSEDFIIEASKGGGWKIEIAGPRRYVAADYGVLDPLLYDIEGRIASLRARGIALQLVSPPPPLAATVGHAADVAFARRLNASTARLVAEGEGLFAGLAVPSLGEPALAADELRRAAGENGFRGVLLPSSVNGKPLDDACFQPLLATIEELNLLAFLHPVSSALSAGLSDYTLTILAGWPTETTVAVARLIFAGVLERHPRLKIVMAHGGGTLPYLLGRIDLGYSAPKYEANPGCRANISRPPSYYLRQLYFDTTVADRNSLAFLIQQMGPDHVLFGSDFPYEIGDADGSIALPALSALDASQRDAILFGNAKRLLA